MAFMSLVIAGIVLCIVGSILLSFVIFLVLGIIMLNSKKLDKRRKQIRCTVFFSAAGVLFVIIAALAFLVFGPKKVTLETPDGDIKISERYVNKVMVAVKAENAAQVSVLLDEHPELVYYADTNRKTFLDMASLMGNTELAAVLVDHGASYDSELTLRHLIYDYSFEMYYDNLCYEYNNEMYKCNRNIDDVYSMTEFMLENGAKAECDGKNVLPMALILISDDGEIEDKEVQLIKLFIDYGADVTDTFGDDSTVYELFERDIEEYGLSGDNVEEISRMLTVS